MHFIFVISLHFSISRQTGGKRKDKRRSEQKFEPTSDQRERPLQDSERADTLEERDNSLISSETVTEDGDEVEPATEESTTRDPGRQIAPRTANAFSLASSLVSSPVRISATSKRDQRLGKKEKKVADEHRRAVERSKRLVLSTMPAILDENDCDIAISPNSPTNVQKVAEAIHGDSFSVLECDKTATSSRDDFRMASFNYLVSNGNAFAPALSGNERNDALLVEGILSRLVMAFGVFGVDLGALQQLTDKQYKGPDAKTFRTKLEELQNMILADLRNWDTEQEEIRIRERSLWRHVGRKAYHRHVANLERYSWHTGVLYDKGKIDEQEKPLEQDTTDYELEIQAIAETAEMHRPPKHDENLPDVDNDAEEAVTEQINNNEDNAPERRTRSPSNSSRSPARRVLSPNVHRRGKKKTKVSKQLQKILQQRERAAAAARDAVEELPATGSALVNEGIEDKTAAPGSLSNPDQVTDTVNDDVSALKNNLQVMSLQPPNTESLNDPSNEKESTVSNTAHTMATNEMTTNSSEVKSSHYKIKVEGKGLSPEQRKYIAKGLSPVVKQCFGPHCSCCGDSMTDSEDDDLPDDDQDVAAVMILDERLRKVADLSPKGRGTETAINNTKTPPEPQRLELGSVPRWSVDEVSQIRSSNPHFDEDMKAFPKSEAKLGEVRKALARRAERTNDRVRTIHERYLEFHEDYIEAAKKTWYSSRVPSVRRFQLVVNKALEELLSEYNQIVEAMEENQRARAREAIESFRAAFKAEEEEQDLEELKARRAPVVADERMKYPGEKMDWLAGRK